MLRQLWDADSGESGKEKRVCGTYLVNEGLHHWQILFDLCALSPDGCGIDPFRGKLAGYFNGTPLAEETETYQVDDIGAAVLIWKLAVLVDGTGLARGDDTAILGRLDILLGQLDFLLGRLLNLSLGIAALSQLRCNRIHVLQC